ncbi:MAG: hypothetical protein K0S04_3755 [Herbinix sp.]|jgi:spore germination cell wall hydrolase CwlJ-like protein|nr:hypothetical protein [Herbinix sp.]
MILTNRIQWKNYLMKVLILMASTALFTFGLSATVYAATNDVQEVNGDKEDNADYLVETLNDEARTATTGVTTEVINEEKEAINTKEDSAPIDNIINIENNTALIPVKAVAAESGDTLNTSVKTTQQAVTKATTTKATTTKATATKTAAKTVSTTSYSKSDLRLLSSLVYAEAGNQSYKGMLAVANVVLNRLDSKAYYHVNTIKEVIYDRKWAVQFSVTVKNKKTGLSPLASALKSYDTGKFGTRNVMAEREALTKAIKAAKSALEGTNNIGKYLCFSNKYSSSSVKRKYSKYKTIGDHIFYRTV